MSVRPQDPNLEASADEAEAEVVQGELVTEARGTRVLAPRRSPAAVAAQTAVVVTTGFVAGAVVAAVVGTRNRTARRRLSEPAPQVLETRRYLVDVHVLGSGH